MEMKNSTRNRWLGYFGIAVATLLSPAGKLISSAVAAGAMVALITMGGTEVVDMKKSPVSARATSSKHMDEYIAKEFAAASDQSIIGPDSGILETYESGAAVTLSTTPPAVIIASNSATGPTSGGSSNAPSGGLGFGPGPFFRGASLPQDSDTLPPGKPDCTEILKRDASEISDLEKAICDPIVTEDTQDAEIPKIVDLPEIPDLADLPPIIITASDPVHTLRTISGDTRSAVGITAIPEPSTLGLMLLGIFSLGWIHRRTAGV